MKKLLFVEVTVMMAFLFVMLSYASAAHAEATKSTERVISIDGSITEIIYALEQQHKLVGVDTTSRYPQAAQQLPDVGYMRQLSAEGILSLNPTLVITTAEAGPKEVLAQLKQAGLAVHTIKSGSSVSGVYEKILQVATLLNVPEKGTALVNQLVAKVRHLKQQLAEQSWNAPPRVMFLLAAGNHGVMLAGKDTQADAMIELMGGTNVVSDFKSYKPLTPEGGLQTQPDIILIADTRGGADVLQQYELLQHTPAAKNQRVIAADSMLLLGFGPRIDQAMATLAPAFYVSR